MVLRRIFVAALLVVGCKQSLFDNNGKGNGDAQQGGDGAQSSCGANCLGDAAADFCGTKIQCLDDHRDRTWAMMTASGADFVGANPANKISKSGTTVLVSTAGNTDAADPALAFTSTSKQVIKLSIDVAIPAAASEHTVRLYRNSREDVLFTGTGAPGATVQTSITVDALQGDRFLLALAPTGAGGADLAVHFFVNAGSGAFPTECQLGLQFTGAAPTTPMIDNACGAQFTSRNEDGSGNVTDIAPTYTAGPFAELGNAAIFALGNYYKGADVMNRMGDTTTQFWMRQDAPGSEDAVMFSDLDLDTGMPGGLAVFRLMSDGNLGAQTCIDATDTSLNIVGQNAAYPAPATGWHFVRVVHTNGQVKICVDGVRTASYALAAGKMVTGYPPYIGRDVIWTPSGAFYAGAIDDVRVLTTALPCN